MEEKKIQRFCNKCNLVTEHDFTEDISNDVRTTVTSCSECGETDTDHDPLDTEIDENDYALILSKEQLEDFARCEEIGNCRECSCYGECDCGAKSLVAKTALVFLDKIEQQQQEIGSLKNWVNDLQSGMYVNCVYCGHRYGTENETPASMADVLKKHIEECPAHPMSELKALNRDLVTFLRYMEKWEADMIMEEKMSLKDVKIFIPEIPKEWKQRTRSGHTNIWNDSFNKNGLPEIKLEPPMRGLYAERFEDGWHWVCGCNKCLNNNERYSYIVCEEHDRCITCGTHRKELTEIPWGHPDGFQCRPCEQKEREIQKAKTLKKAKKNGHNEFDCFNTREIICPVCASECSSEDVYGHDEHDITCHVCDTDFVVEVEYEVRYTSRL